MRILENVRGPMTATTRYLAELGADVVRIDTPSDPREIDWIANNRGKRVTGTNRLEDLLAGADAYVSDDRALDLGALATAHPNLVVLHITPFGKGNEFSDWQGSDAVFHAQMGELARSGLPDKPPLLPPGQLAYACAATQAAFALLAALHEARAKGTGDTIDFSILDGASQALDPGFGLSGSATSGRPLATMPRGRPKVGMMYPFIPCKDGTVRLCVMTKRHWHAMFAWMGSPEAFADPLFNSMIERFRSPDLLPAFAAFFADKTCAEIEATTRELGIPLASVFEFEDAIATEQMQARKTFVDVEIASGASAPFPNGTTFVDGQRMGSTSDIPNFDPELEWLERAPLPSPARPADADFPLADLKVLDLGAIVVGAEGSRLLADLGADVIKIESSSFPDGMRQNATKFDISPTFVTGHRNKRSLGLNLRSHDGKAILRDLVKQSDVLLANFRGGVLQSLGFDYASLKAINPRIIVGQSSAFGETGPWSQLKGYGPLVRAWAGLSRQWRYPDDPESMCDASTVYPDHTASRIGAIATLALLYRRERTGEGGDVDISQAEVMLSQFGAQIAADALSRAGHAIPVPANREDSTVYPCAGDDEWCTITIRSASDEAAIASVTGDTPLAEWCAARDPREVMTTLQSAGVPAAAMLRVAEMPEFAYFQQRGFFRKETHPRLPMDFWMETSAYQSRHVPAPPTMPAPDLCQHTAEILRDRLGLDEARITELAEAGAVELGKA